MLLLEVRPQQAKGRPAKNARRSRTVRSAERDTSPYLACGPEQACAEVGGRVTADPSSR
jgi:hypothetical protein